MRILSFSLKITLLALLPLLVITSCDDDPVEPETATITGTVTIENADTWATWKDSGEVQITIFPAFSLNPPAGWGDVPDGALGPNVPGGRFAIGAPYNAQNPIILNYSPGVTQYHYTMTVEPDTYSALAVGFRHNTITNPSLRTATLGVHWDNPDSVSHGIVIFPFIGGNAIFNYPAPTAITVVAGDNINIDFKVDFDFVEQWY